MSELTAFNAYCRANGINANGQLATEDLEPAFSAGYKARQNTLRQRVAELEQQLIEVRRAERERCAKVCEDQANEPECTERAMYCAEAIRAME